MKKIIAWVIALFLLAGSVVLPENSYASAEATKAAMKVLKGVWHTNYQPGMQVRFTKKYCKYYSDDGKVYSKWKIVSTVKKPYGYLIKLKKGKYKISFRTYAKDWNELEYYGSWGNEGYSGSSGLYKEK